MTTDTLEKPELKLEDGIPDDVDSVEDDGDGGGAFLVTFLGGGYEVAELAGTSDEDLTLDELVERFDNAEKKNATWLRVGRRRFRMSNINSFGPEDEVDYPEITLFQVIEERVDKLLKATEHTINSIGQSAQGVSFLTQQQAALQEAQASLFQSIQAEEQLAAAQEEDSLPPHQPQPQGSPAAQPRPPGSLKPLRRALPPGISPQQ